MKAKEGRKEEAYSPVCVLYKSVKPRLVGVALIQFASLEMNIDFVDADAIEAAHICQSAFGLLAFILLNYWSGSGDVRERGDGWKGGYILYKHFEYQEEHHRFELQWGRMHSACRR
jgi:hypothetical protein